MNLAELSYLHLMWFATLILTAGTIGPSPTFISILTYFYIHTTCKCKMGAKTVDWLRMRDYSGIENTCLFLMYWQEDCL